MKWILEIYIVFLLKILMPFSILKLGVPNIQLLQNMQQLVNIIDYSSSNSHPLKKNFSAETSFGKQK